MTLQSQIAADATAVFLNTAELGESITHYRRGDLAEGATVTAVVETDYMPEAEPNVDDARGARRVRAGRIWLATSVTVDDTERRENRSVFKIGTELWRTDKVIKEDSFSGMQCVYVTREEPIQSNRTRTGP